MEKSALFCSPPCGNFKKGFKWYTVQTGTVIKGNIFEYLPLIILFIDYARFCISINDIRYSYTVGNPKFLRRTSLFFFLHPVNSNKNSNCTDVIFVNQYFFVFISEIFHTKTVKKGRNSRYNVKKKRSEIPEYEEKPLCVYRLCRVYDGINDQHKLYTVENPKKPE